jgi:hypothetical protein
MRSDHLYKIRVSKPYRHADILTRRYDGRVMYLDNNRLYTTTYNDEKEMAWETPCQGITAIYFDLEKVIL